MIRKKAKQVISNFRKPPNWQQEKIDSMKRLEKGFEVLIRQNDKMIELLEEIHKDIHELKDKQVNIYYTYPQTTPNPITPRVEVV